MRTSSRKRRINVALKVAIVESGQKAQAIAFKARITPDRLSKIANRRVTASDEERKALAKALGRSVNELFPDVAEPLAAASGQ